MKEKQLKIFESDNLWESIFKMVVPALIAILVMLIYNLADMIFVGQTGETGQVAAISVAGPIFNLIMAVAMLISSGGSVLISSDLGKKDKEHARMVSSLCIWSALVLGILAGVLVIFFHRPLLSLLGATDDIWLFTRNYMLILAIGAPFLLISNMFGQMLRAEGAFKEGLIGNLLGTVINIILDPLFILVLRKGVVGAAIATVLGNMVATAYYLFYIKRKAVVINLDPKYARMKPAYIIAIMSLGLPNAVSTFLSGFSSSFANKLLAGYGSDAIASNAAAGRVNLIITMLLMGICMGAQPLMSYNFGAGNRQKLSGVIKRILILTTAVGAVATISVVFFRSAVIGLFLKNASIAAMSEEVLKIMMISSPFMGLFYLGTNFLQAIRKATMATFLSAMQKGLLLIPLLFLLESIYGILGIRYAYVLADLLSVMVAVTLMIYNWRREV